MRLSILGDASLHLPLRVLNLLAQQGVDCTQASFVLGPDGCRILIDASAASGERDELVVETLRSMVLVSQVDLLD